METRGSPRCGGGRRTARGGVGATGAWREASAGEGTWLGVDDRQAPGKLRGGVEVEERVRTPFQRSAGAGVARVVDEVELGFGHGACTEKKSKQKGEDLGVFSVEEEEVAAGEQCQGVRGG